MKVVNFTHAHNKKAVSHEFDLILVDCVFCDGNLEVNTGIIYQVKLI